jgi:hypothetical protein
VELKVAIERLGGVVVEEAQPSLDEVFVGRVGGSAELGARSAE